MLNSLLVEGLETNGQFTLGSDEVCSVVAVIRQRGPVLSFKTRQATGKRVGAEGVRQLDVYRSTRETVKAAGPSFNSAPKNADLQ